MIARTRLKASAVLIALSLAMSLAAAPARADQPNMQALQGAWAGSNGSDTMLLMFMGNICGLSLNGREMYGMWSLSGDRLNMQFQNGKSLSYTVDLRGDSLILDGSVQLTRQAMPGQPGGPAVGGVPGGQPGNPWGQPQPPPQTGGQPGGQPEIGRAHV